MKKTTKIIFLLVFYCFGHFTTAQNVIPVKLEIEKEIPGETFANKGLKLEFWIAEQNKFISLDTTKTKMLVLEDDLGTNILKAHQKAIAEYEKQQKENGYLDFHVNNKNIIDLENTRALNDAIGFKLLLSSSVLPVEKAKELHLKAVIAYFAEDASAPVQSTIIKNFTPQNEVADWQGKSITVVKNGASSYDENDERNIGYSLQNSDIGVAVKEIDMVDNSGNIIKNLGYLYMEEGKLNFEIPEKEISSPLNLKFTYTPLKSVSLPIDTRISIGL
ncbi:hypothetical protein [Yeosuana marina]|uniref:hypothetical protein n=1 Tax=Yeosuana marina TaxID=1565536 RepID=UPI0030EF2D83|tara:strand:+ start:5610 stop:6434 length:825 start_codon:yes stop_codon:yes gene_type:complete